MIRIDNEQNRGIPQYKEESNMETYLAYSHLQILQKSARSACPLIMPNQEVRQVESLSFPTLANPAAIRSEIKSECRSTLPFVLKGFSKLIIGIIF